MTGASDDAEPSDEERRITASATPPVAKRVQSRREFHGDVFIDQYEWLRDKSSPEVLAYLEAENNYADETTGQLEPLRQRISTRSKHAPRKPTCRYRSDAATGGITPAVSKESNTASNAVVR